MGNDRKIGFTNVFLISLFLSPIIGALVALGSDKQSAESSPTDRKAQADRLYNESFQNIKSNHLEEANTKLLQVVALQPKYFLAHYNLACNYSRLKKKDEAFKFLSLAIESGYTNFNKIKSDPDLAFLRSQMEFVTFVSDGYRLPDILTDSNDVLDRLERLAMLKEKGVLTDSEFNEQKSKLLKKL
jgi:tetratricopeptide (TPR) repeat protein